MKIVKKRYSPLIALFVAVNILFFPILQAKAITGTPYGGHERFFIPCTCTYGAFNWHFFGPFFNVSVPMVGALVAPITPLAYSTYYLKPQSWILGFFAPGAGVCAVGHAPFCVPLPNMGAVTPFAGTSLPTP